MLKLTTTSLIYIIVVTVFLFFIVKIAKAQVVINEISPSEEWVELFNTSSTSQSLDGCTLSMGDGGQTITYSSTDTIGVLGYKVSEKDITAGWNSNWLNNSGDSVTLDCPSLTDNNVSFGDVGVNTYGRSPNGSGDFTVLASTTKDGENSGPSPSPTTTPTNTPTATPTASPSPTATPKTPTPKPTAKPTPLVLSEGTESPPPSNSEILNLRGGLATMDPQEQAEVNQTKKGLPFLPWILILFGVSLISFTAFRLFLNMKEGYNNESV